MLKSKLLIYQPTFQDTLHSAIIFLFFKKKNIRDHVVLGHWHVYETWISLSDL